jgi:hypothetical protein
MPNNEQIYFRTSLLNALIKKTASERPVLTDGIDIKEWTINFDDNSNLVYSMWDFGMPKL